MTLRSGDVDCEDLISGLLRSELVTNLQIDRVLKGERTGYFYGHYKILYLIGAGTFLELIDRSTARLVE